MKVLLENAILEGRNRLLMENPYFKNLRDKTDPSEFESMCIDLYHLADRFHDAIGIRYERFRDQPETIFKEHWDEEKGHAEMLRRWMLQMGMKDPREHKPSVYTENYISIIYRAAATMDKDLSLLVINGAGEGTAQDFYLKTYHHFKQLGLPKLHYWHLHAEVDQEHGNILHYISDEMSEQQLSEALHYIHVTLEAIYNMKAHWLH